MKGSDHLFGGVVLGVGTGIALTLAHRTLPVEGYADASTLHLFFSDASFPGFWAAAACIVGSLWPDIDKADTIASTYFVLGRTIAGRLRLRHRAFTHSLPSLLFLLAIFFSFWQLVGAHGTYRKSTVFGFGLGYLLHLLQDASTHDGIMFLYPFSSKPFHFPSKKWARARSAEKENEDGDHDVLFNSLVPAAFLVLFFWQKAALLSFLINDFFGS